MQSKQNTKSIPATHGTLQASTANISWSMLFMEITSVYSQFYSKQIHSEGKK
jgi:hypothetical protein